MKQNQKNTVLILRIQPQADEHDKINLLVDNTIEILFGEITPNTIPIIKSLIENMSNRKLDKKSRDKLQNDDQQEVCFKIGLDKTQQVTITINQMEITLKEEERQFYEATQKVNQLLSKLEQQERKLNHIEEEVAVASKQYESYAEQFVKERQEVDRELEPGLILLRLAQEAIDSIEHQRIIELKQGKILEISKYIIDSVLVLFRAKLIPIQIEERVFNKREGNVVKFLKESYDEYGIQTLGDMNFMKKLKEYDWNQINEEMIELLEPYFSQSKDWFNDYFAARASKAIAGILKWVMRISESYQTQRNIISKKKQLAIDEDRLKLSQKIIGKSHEELANIQDYVKRLKQELSKEMEEKNQLEMKAAKIKKIIYTAKTLITSLSVLNDKFGKNSSDSKCILLLDNNIFLFPDSFSNSYPFDAELCNQFSWQNYFGDSQKLNGIVTLGLELTNLFIGDTDIQGFDLQILVKDDLSIQKYISCLSLIIEDIENLVEPMIGPMLQHQVILKGKTAFVNFGDTKTEYAKEFCPVMIYRLLNLSFSSQLSAETTIIDSSDTHSYIDNQLLKKTIPKDQQGHFEYQNQLFTDISSRIKKITNHLIKIVRTIDQPTGNFKRQYIIHGYDE